MGWRTLSAPEIEQLEKQLNSADDWNMVSVVDAFIVDNIRRTHFSGKVFIDENVMLSNVGLIADYKIGKGCKIFNVNEISFSGYSFDFPVEIRNEDGSHTITACPELTTADAYLASEKESEGVLQSMASSAGDLAALSYGHIGQNVEIRNVNALRNVYLEDCTSISESTLLENVFVHSSAEESTRIGAGVIMQNAIVGYQNTVDTNTIARSVVAGNHVSLTEGLRITHCVVGDNSHLSCCEVLFSLMFPFHEQHHNNSFLIASFLQGQSNIAAGATLGSNHNGRKNDCEMRAGRGFWPGLCSSVKFPSDFASYTLLAKGDYPYEIHLKLPFCLINNNVHDNVLEIMPAYWWMYNTFALRRNAEKFRQRDTRKTVSQHIHYQPLAPDTVQEVLAAMNLMMMGEEHLTQGVERSKRKVRILKFREAFAAYREMLIYYAVTTLQNDFDEDLNRLLETVKKAETITWMNVGGQLMRKQDVDLLKATPCADWKSMHDQYDRFWNEYETHNRQTAGHVLKYLCDCKPTKEKLQMIFEEGRDIVRDFDLRADAERERDLNARE